MKIWIVVLLLLPYIRTAFAQEDCHTATFLKRMENNLVKSTLEEILPDGSVKPYYNLDGKTDMEKLLFGDSNALVEFFFDSDSLGISGFRVIEVPSDKSYLLEVKSISNFKEVNEELSETYPSIGFTAEQLAALTDSMIRQSSAHNRDMDFRRQEERKKRYRVETKSFRIGDRLAEALHDRTVALIERFDSKTGGRSADYRVTFRGVVGPEVWMLSINDEPRGDALVLSDLYRRIISDAGSGQFNEPAYIGFLTE